MLDTRLPLLWCITYCVYIPLALRLCYGDA